MTETKINPLALINYALTFLQANILYENVQDLLGIPDDVEITEEQREIVERAFENLWLPIHITMIHHKHGVNVYAALSGEKLDEQLYDYVSEYWPERFGGWMYKNDNWVPVESVPPIPTNIDDAIEEYFNDHPSEYIDYESAFVEIPKRIRV